MDKERNKKDDFYLFLAMLDDKSLQQVLIYFDYSEIVYFMRKIDSVDLSTLDSEIAESLLVEFNELMMFSGQSMTRDIIGKALPDKLNQYDRLEDYSERYSTLQSPIDFEKSILIQKFIQQLRTKFNQKKFAREIFLVDMKWESYDDLTLDQQLRKELYDNANNLAIEISIRTAIVLNYILNDESR